MNRISVFCFLLFLINITLYGQNVIDEAGALVRSDTLQKNIYLCFTGHDQVEGFDHVLMVLKNQDVKGSFFLTGDFIRRNGNLVKRMAENGHYLGAHSDKHLLYCDWTKRDSLLHSEQRIRNDISRNLKALRKLGIYPTHFMPPYEWYNKKVVDIASQLNQITMNFSSGTRSNADYTTPDMPNYISSEAILESIHRYRALHGMNGFHLLIHPGTHPKRKDKFYLKLEGLITDLKEEGYQFSRF